MKVKWELVVDWLIDWLVLMFKARSLSQSAGQFVFTRGLHWQGGLRMKSKPGIWPLQRTFGGWGGRDARAHLSPTHVGPSVLMVSDNRCVRGPSWKGSLDRWTGHKGITRQRTWQHRAAQPSTAPHTVHLALHLGQRVLQKKTGRRLCLCLFSFLKFLSSNPPPLQTAIWESTHLFESPHLGESPFI